MLNAVLPGWYSCLPRFEDNKWRWCCDKTSHKLSVKGSQNEDHMLEAGSKKGMPAGAKATGVVTTVTQQVANGAWTMQVQTGSENCNFVSDAACSRNGKAVAKAAAQRIVGSRSYVTASS